MQKKNFNGIDLNYRHENKFNNTELNLEELQHLSRDTTNPTMWLCAQRRLRSAWASAQSDQSLRWPHGGSLDP